MPVPTRLFALIHLVVFYAFPLIAQEEISDDSGPASSWTMLSVHRTWSPQKRDVQNSGFGIQSFFDVDRSRRTWFGFAFRGTGVNDRQMISIMAGPAYYLLGDSRLGAFAYLQTGIGFSSSRGSGGFDFFSDPTMTIGLSTIAGVGGNIEINRWLRLHAAVVSSWFTNEQGQTPYGVQVGITFGGR